MHLVNLSNLANLLNLLNSLNLLNLPNLLNLLNLLSIDLSNLLEIKYKICRDTNLKKTFQTLAVLLWDAAPPIRMKDLRYSFYFEVKIYATDIWSIAQISEVKQNIQNIPKSLNDSTNIKPGVAPPQDCSSFSIVTSPGSGVCLFEEEKISWNTFTWNQFSILSLTL